MAGRCATLRATCWVAVLGALVLTIAGAAPGPDIVRVDLDTLIDAATEHPTQFAVDIAYSHGLGDVGTWTSEGARAVWRHEITVPSAVSMSFHAREFALPVAGRLTVSGAGKTHVYSRADAARDGLWSRILPGDTLALELVVPQAQRGSARLFLSSVQAGYRALVPGARNHPHYDARNDALRQKSGSGLAQQSLVGAACVANGQCNQSTEGISASWSTAVVTVRNLTQCTGTLVNDVPSSSTPHLLTARHCQTTTEAGDPTAASGLRVYWNAVSACGQLLRSFYDTYTYSQSGATTIVEQHDVWLVRLDAPPADQSVEQAGIDATGGTFTGGFSYHHALGGSQQFARWYGQVVTTTRLRNGASAPVWRTAAAAGNIGKGASGGGLFEPTGRLVGVLSLGRFADGDTSGYGVCPTTPLTAPTESNWAAEFVSLGGLWDLATDPTSSTNPHTLREVLDPGNTGQRLINPRLAAPRINLYSTPAAANAVTGASVTLTWTATRADTCSASGGGPGTAWSGPVERSGSRVITESVPGNYTYRLTCANADRSRTVSLPLTWIPPPRTLTFVQPTITAPLFVGDRYTLQWSSNHDACVATGGDTGDGWAGPKPPSGSTEITAFRLGHRGYSLDCTTGDQRSRGNVGLAWHELSAFIQVDPPQTLRVGQPFGFQYYADGSTCTASGGMPGDGWAGPIASTVDTNLFPRPRAWIAPTTAIPGSYVYRLECTSSTATLAAEVPLTLTADPPAASISAAAAVQLIDLAGAPSPNNLSWRSNVKNCQLLVVGPEPVAPRDVLAEGSGLDQRETPGLYTYTLGCGSGTEAATASTQIRFDWPPAEVALNAYPDSVRNLADDTLLLWTSNVLPCTATGGSGGDGWGGDLPRGGGRQIRPVQPGTYTYAVTCGPPGNQLRREATLQFNPNPAPAFEYFRAFSTTLAPGQNAFLEWRANYAESCIASEGLGGDQWAGPRNPVYSVVVTSLVPGTVRYALTCSNQVGTTTRYLTIEWVGPAIASASLSVEPAEVAVGETFTLRWTSTNAAACTASGGAVGDGWAGNRGPAGNFQASLPSAGTRAYQLQCDNSPLAVVFVNVRPRPNPAVTLTASTANIVLGNSMNLSWTSVNATSCQASGGDTTAGGGPGAWPGPKDLAGSQTLTPAVAGTFNYSMACRDSSAESVSSVTLQVDAPPAPTAALTASPQSVQTGQSFTLSWSSTDTTSCTAGGGATGDGWAGSGTLATQGSRAMTIGAAGTYTYSVQCQGGGGTVTARATVTASRPAGGGGGGGGGAAGAELAGLLAALTWIRRRRVERRREPL